MESLCPPGCDRASEVSICLEDDTSPEAFLNTEEAEELAQRYVLGSGGHSTCYRMIAEAGDLPKLKLENPLNILQSAFPSSVFGYYFTVCSAFEKVYSI